MRHNAELGPQRLQLQAQAEQALQTPLTRRRFLRAIAELSAAIPAGSVLLAACGGGEEQASKGASDENIATTTPPSSSNESTPTLKPSPTNTQEPTNTPTLPPTETPEPTATSTATATATSTATPLPTETPTPEATATPEKEPETHREWADKVGYRYGTQVTPDALFDPLYAQLLRRQFNTALVGGILNWIDVRPSQDTFNFQAADRVLDFAKSNKMEVQGLHLIWGWDRDGGLRVPPWLEEKDGLLSPEEFLQLTHDHVAPTMEHFKGKVKSWSVVNEPFNDQGEYKTTDFFTRNSPRSDGVDPDFIEQSLRLAHEIDPDAILFINDYNNQEPGPRSDALYNLVRRLQEKNAPIQAVGMQMHLNAARTPDISSVQAMAERVKGNMERFKRDLGVDVFITEWDVMLHNLIHGELQMPKEEAFSLQAEIFRYGFRAYAEAKVGNRVSFWGSTDYTHWTNWDPNSPELKDADPLIFDDSLKPKPAYHALTEEFQRLATSNTQ